MMPWLQTEMTKETPKKPAFKRNKKSKRRTMLETPDLRWKAGKESRVGTVLDRPLNSRMIKTDLGMVHVSDSKWFQKGLQVPVWREPEGERMYCKGRPRQLSRW